MPKPTTEIDIFDDDDLARGAAALSDATSEPASADAELPNQLAEKPAPENTEGTPADEKPVEGADELPGVLHVPEPTDAALRLRVRQTTRARFDTFKVELGAALGGARIGDSNLGRAIVDSILFEAADEIVATARAHGEIMQRPRTDDPVACEQFDRKLREVISRGLAAWATTRDV